MIRRFWRDDSAATAVEYGVIAVFISMAVIAGATGIGTRLMRYAFNPAAAALN